MQVPFLDLKAQNRSIWDELQAALAPVMENAQFILGPGVDRFEADFAKYVGVKHCVGLNNGTSALQMALIALDVKAGDEIITTPHTWISTSWAISYVGAKPVFVDVDPKSYNIDAARIEAAITTKTKAILPVHLYGQSADLTALRAIADKHGLALLEDAAQAHGARWNGQRTGSVGHAGCFSFYPGKNLGAFGEAGAVVTNDADVAARIRRLRDHAQDGRHHHVEIGFNTRMEGIQGAVLQVKLKHLDDWNARRRAHAERYRQLLEGAKGIETPTTPHADAHVWHVYAVLVSGVDREAVRARMNEAGVATGVHYPTIVPLQPAYAYLGRRKGEFPIAEDVASRCISLPMFAELTDDQIEYVAKTLRASVA
jgi:dTDP-4-amino-4,6-dideoxygalactose transaminase